MNHDILSFRRFDPSNPPLPLHRTERGGEVTYHGPGQLVMYPILNLQRLEPDLHLYLRGLEETVIRCALYTAFGIFLGPRVPNSDSTSEQPAFKPLLSGTQPVEEPGDACVQ